MRQNNIPAKPLEIGKLYVPTMYAGVKTRLRPVN
jgi:hypothetical protein